MGSREVNRILIRQDYLPSGVVKRRAEQLMKTSSAQMYRPIDPKTAWNIDCPLCKMKMRRQFFVQSYPVEVDRCLRCSGVWFDALELELLQYMYEHKAKFLYGVK